MLGVASPHPSPLPEGEGADRRRGTLMRQSRNAAARVDGAASLADITSVLDEPEYRVEGPLKVSGRARYTADIRLPGTLSAKFLKSPHAHALIRSVDTSAAKRLPGVHAVLTGEDIGPRRAGKVLWDWPALAYE